VCFVWVWCESAACYRSVFFIVSFPNKLVRAKNLWYTLCQYLPTKRSFHRIKVGARGLWLLSALFFFLLGLLNGYHKAYRDDLQAETQRVARSETQVDSDLLLPLRLGPALESRYEIRASRGP